mgnify:CR=1 FL=1
MYIVTRVLFDDFPSSIHVGAHVNMRYVCMNMLYVFRKMYRMCSSMCNVMQNVSEFVCGCTPFVLCMCL